MTLIIGCEKDSFSISAKTKQLLGFFLGRKWLARMVTLLLPELMSTCFKMMRTSF